MRADDFYILIISLFALMLGGVTGKIASDKGGSFTLWFIAGTFLTIIALPLAVFLSAEQIGPRSSKKCPKCAEEIKREALVCKHCPYEFTSHDDLKIT